MRKNAIFLLFFLMLFYFGSIEVGADTPSYNIAYLSVSSSYIGSDLALFIPLNFTSITSSNIYVIFNQAPVPIHIFSSYPPFIILFQTGIPAAPVYQIYQVVQNPYSSYLVPYSNSVFGAYDDFDYNSGMWAGVNFTIQGGKSLISSGYMTFNTSVPANVAALYNIIGGRSFAVYLNQTGNLIFNISGSQFTDWSLLSPNGSDIYFLDSNGNPIYFGIINLDKNNQVLTVYVEASTAVIYMMYGGTNPYSSYRLF
ncbi:MAG: hypothetical protein QW575_07970 [Thermoproteota archaeon]